MLVVLLVLLLVAPVSAGDRRQRLAERAFERSQRATVKEQRGDTLAGRVRALRVPMPQSVRMAPLSELGIQNAYGAADPQTGTIYSDGKLDRYALAHETMHLLPLGERDQRRFARIMGQPQGQWWADAEPGSAAWRGSLGERFADMGAMVATGFDPRHGSVSAYMDEMPTQRQLLRFGRALERYGRRNGLPPYRPPAQSG